MEHHNLTDYPAMMDVTQTAAFLRTGKAAIYKIAKQEEFPAVIVGGKVRIIRDKLLAWLERHRGF
ncbi:MAG: helix-turn-helix domain-containing protein [Sporomusaceae bacterium]|nr:helix-turn-helix domain-containing protein [Sporomusaceae bacterium]